MSPIAIVGYVAGLVGKYAILADKPIKSAGILKISAGKVKKSAGISSKDSKFRN